MPDIFNREAEIIQTEGIEVFSFLERVVNSDFKQKHNKPVEFSKKEQRKLRRYYKLNDRFKKLTGISDTWENQIKFRTYEEFLNFTSLEKGSFVLDIGCGLGYKIMKFAEQYPDLIFVGTDVDSYKLEQFAKLAGERKLTNIIIVHSSIFDNVFKNATFSAIISTQVFEHFAGTEYPQIFQAVADICKPGADICIEVPGNLFLKGDYKVYDKMCKKPENLEKYPVLADYKKDGILPAFKYFEHYVPGYSYDYFNQFLPLTMYFVNYKYTICKKTAGIFQYKTLNKAYWGPVLFISEHIRGRREDKKYSKESGYNLIIHYRIVDNIPGHIYKK